MPVATYVFEVDWGDDGSFTGADVVTSDVLARSPVIIDRGVDPHANVPFGGLLATGITFDLDNNDWTYHPENSGSSLFGDLEPGRQVQVRTTSPSAVTLGRGCIETFRVDPNPSSRLVELDALGAIASFQGSTISIPVDYAATTGDAIGLILDELGWPAGRRALDTGATLISAFWLENEDALDALRTIVQSEGPGAALFENGDGDIVFHDRHRRLTAAASSTSQATFRDTGTEPVFGIPHDYDKGFDRIINRVTIRPNRSIVDPIVNLVGELKVADLVASNGGTQSYTFSIENPVVEFVDPESNLRVFPGGNDDDVALSSTFVIKTEDGSDIDTAWISASYDVTVGTDFTLTITNDSTTKNLIVTELSPIGDVLLPNPVEVVSVDNTTSQSTYGLRALTLEDVWMDINTARDLATVIVNDYKDPTKTVGIVVSNDESARLTQALTREVNDRVTIIESGSGMNDEFFVQRITHDITHAGNVHRTRFGCVEVGTPLVAANEVFILDDATQGKLNTGKLGY